MGRANFQQVVSEFSSASEGDYSASVEALERMILDHTPTSSAEAASMLDVIIPDVEAGGRSDGRDIEALGRIRAYLSTAD